MSPASSGCAWVASRRSQVDVGELDPDRPGSLWLIAALALHDGVIAPLTAGTGVFLTRVPLARVATSRAR